MVDAKKTVLVTGAAGFVGSHTVDLLVERGYDVMALDSLDPQVHGADDSRPRHLAAHLRNEAIRFIHGNVRDRPLMERLLGEVDAVIHLAAAVGVGQSMYMPYHYTDVNVAGTVLLMDILANHPHRIKKIVVASSMSIYGEGAYRCPKCGVVYPTDRTEQQLAQRRWEHTCPICAGDVQPAATAESKPLVSTSIYAISKKTQEEMLLVFGKAYKLPVVALRYFNIYGPRQSLNNPYTGVAAIFISRLLNKKPPLVFEDGHQSRDFIHVRDIARANVLALEAPGMGQCVYNVGTGKPTTVLDVVKLLNDGLGLTIGATIANQFRAGDIRHCYSDSSRIASELGFKAEIAPEQGFQELIEWSRSQIPVDRFEKSLAELTARKLVL